MIKIIDGKRYNTESATLVHEWYNGYSSNDFKFRMKDLYVTQNGAWFIHHAGGAMTDMAVSEGDNSYGGSEAIEPVSEEDAYRFLESHGGEEAIEQYFSERVQDA